MRDVRLLLISSVFPRWKDSRPGKDWARSFRDRWKHLDLLRKKQKRRSIKQSRAMVGTYDDTATVGTGTFTVGY